MRGDSCTEDVVCGGFAICDRTLGKCVEPPPCGRGGTCPAFELGAVCNVGGGNLLPGQACLVGRCAHDLDCPTHLACHFDAADGGEPEPFGHCR